MTGEVLRYAPGDVGAHLFSRLTVYVKPVDQYIHTVRADSLALFAFTPSGEIGHVTILLTCQHFTIFL